MNIPNEKELSVISEAVVILRWCLAGVAVNPTRSWSVPGISIRVERSDVSYIIWPDGEEAVSCSNVLEVLKLAANRAEFKRNKITKLREEADALESQLSGMDADDGPRMDAGGDAMPKMQRAAS